MKTLWLAIFGVVFAELCFGGSKGQLIWEFQADNGSTIDCVNTEILSAWIDNKDLSGILTIFSHAGSRITSKEYKDGVLDGEFMSWHTNGTPCEVGEYKRGKKVGRWEMRWPEGQLWQVGAYSNGFCSGVWKCWHRNGQLDYEGTYVDGKRNGTWRSWDPSGQLSVEEMWEDGVCVSRKGNIAEMSWAEWERRNLDKAYIRHLLLTSPSTNLDVWVLVAAKDLSRGSILADEDLEEEIVSIGGIVDGVPISREHRTLVPGKKLRVELEKGDPILKESLEALDEPLAQARISISDITEESVVPPP